MLFVFDNGMNPGHIRPKFSPFISVQGYIVHEITEIVKLLLFCRILCYFLFAARDFLRISVEKRRFAGDIFFGKIGTEAAEIKTENDVEASYYIYYCVI